MSTPGRTKLFLSTLRKVPLVILFCTLALLAISLSAIARGDELGYGSDLDVVFLHNSEGDKQKTAGGDGKTSIDNMTFFCLRIWHAPAYPIKRGYHKVCVVRFLSPKGIDRCRLPDFRSQSIT